MALMSEFPSVPGAPASATTAAVLVAPAAAHRGGRGTLVVPAVRVAAPSPSSVGAAPAAVGSSRRHGGMCIGHRLRRRRVLRAARGSDDGRSPAPSQSLVVGDGRRGGHWHHSPPLSESKGAEIERSIIRVQ